MPDPFGAVVLDAMSVELLINKLLSDEETNPEKRQRGVDLAADFDTGLSDKKIPNDVVQWAIASLIVFNMVSGTKAVRPRPGRSLEDAQAYMREVIISDIMLRANYLWHIYLEGNKEELATATPDPNFDFRKMMQRGQE